MPNELRKLKRFRFQLLHTWIITHYPACRVADVGGGKGLLTYLLRQSGYDAIVIDPYDQPLPKVYKDLSGKRHKIKSEETVPRISKGFVKEMAKDFNLIVGLHTHGSNMNIIDITAEYHKDFVLLPCCVIDEPIIPQADINWLDSLEEYAKQIGHQVKRFELNFKGQNIGLYTQTYLDK
ncbi:MAG TPA: hypothetical protein VLG69_01575 [Candidatus Andersenbacteria bacterium]|nr:hypothetical protein [Candidatus Andersenbacteria bacterium]